MDLETAAGDFTRHLADVRRLSRATVRAYRSDLEDLGRAVGPIAIADIDLEHLRE